MTRFDRRRVLGWLIASVVASGVALPVGASAIIRRQTYEWTPYQFALVSWPGVKGWWGDSALPVVMDE